MTQRYVLIGAGGTGTHLLPPLLAYLTTYHDGVDSDVWELGVIDGDNVEPKNLSRQLFNPSTLTLNKARASVLPFRYMRNLVAIPDYLGPDNIEKHLTEGCVVLIAVDNFPVRALIERHCLTLDDAIVINGGNEEDTGSCQVWIRKDGQNLTPTLSFLHPEINRPGEDRALLSCQQLALLDGGEQLIVSNMSSAMWMLAALINVHRDKVNWTELHFDALLGKTYSMDNRARVGWK